MICPNCGTDNAAENRYCSHCGDALTLDLASNSRRPAGDNPEYTRVFNRYPENKSGSTHRYESGNVQNAKRYYVPDNYDEEQPRTDAPRNNAPFERELDIERDARAYDYNDNFDNNRYEKTSREDYRQYEYAAMQTRKKHAANVPYLIVAYFTALVSLLNFVLPFLNWARFSFRLDVASVYLNEKLSVVTIINKLFKINNISDVFGDSIKNIMSWDVVPNFIGKSYDSLNAALAFSKLAALIIFGFMGLALLLYVIFFVLAVFRRKSATGFGISAAIIMLLTSGGFIFALQYISAQTGGMLTLENGAYLSITLSVVMIVLISVMSILRSFSGR
ncbi:MAG TPA: hypothetical protein DEO32_04850 [Ruminococcaceae bacterium]|nr:hypothetical protein [Oscillospiraceae bacterium]